MSSMAEPYADASVGGTDQEDSLVRLVLGLAMTVAALAIAGRRVLASTG